VQLFFIIIKWFNDIKTSYGNNLAQNLSSEEVIEFYFFLYN